MLPAISLLALQARAADWQALGGVDYIPFGRADLAWIEGGHLSGTTVSETDGWLSPPLTAFGGVVRGRDALLVGFGLARLTSTTWVSGEDDEPVRSVVHYGAARPSVDYRRFLGAPAPGRATPWLGAGLFGVIPSARRSSDAYTRDEARAADDVAAQDRSRIGALGARMGAGADVRWENGLALGARYALTWQGSRVVEEDATVAGVLVWGEAGLVLSFWF